MPVSINQPTDVLLTAADVQRWREEYVQAAAIAADRKRKLEAADVFFPGAASVLGGTQTAERRKETPPAEPTLLDRAVQVINECHRVMAPREVRAELIKRGHEVTSENYLYTALKRAAERNLIKKLGNQYGPASSPSPEGEAAAQKDGGPYSHLTLLGGAVGAVPEAGGT